MKRRDVIRAIGASATLGVTAGAAAAAPDCDYCEQFDYRECPDYCHYGCDPCIYP